MDIIWLGFWSFVLCLFVASIIYTFPVSYSRSNMKSGMQKIQHVFLVVCGIGGLVSILLITVFKVSLLFIEFKLAIMCILIVSCVIFSALLYYPSTRLLVKINNEDQGIISQLILTVFSSIFSNDVREREKSLLDLKSFCNKNESMLKQYGLLIYLIEYPKLINPTTFQGGEKIINFLISKCDQVKNEIDGFNPAPFPNIGLVLSFAFSTILTILLSIFTLNP